MSSCGKPCYSSYGNREATCGWARCNLLASTIDLISIFLHEEKSCPRSLTSESSNPAEFLLSQFKKAQVNFICFRFYSSTI